MSDADRHPPILTNSRVTSPLRSGAAVDVGAIAAVWCAAVAVANPIGDFPLNDDWSYGMAVQRLLDGGVYRPTGWTSMPLITHVLWGALFSGPLGFSFTVLRFSTLTLSLLGVLAMYALIRQLGRPRLLAVACALTVAFNPVHFALSHTFMADVPFTTWVVLASLFFVRHLQSGSIPDLVVATVFSLAATLTRQLGLCVPLAFAATVVLRHGRAGHWLLRAAVPSIVSIAALVVFQRWLTVTGRLPMLYELKSKALARVLEDVAALPVTLGHHAWSALMYLGGFLLAPLTLAVMNRRSAGRSLFPVIGALFFLGASVTYFMIKPSLMPVSRNMIVPEGIGPLSLRDVDLPPLPSAFWLMVTVLCVLGATLFVLHVIRFLVDLVAAGGVRPAGDDDVAGTFFLLCALAYLTPLLPLQSYDRYFVPVTAFLTAFLAASTVGAARPRYVPAVLLIVGSAIFAVMGTRDYLAWNRARWEALDDLHHRDRVPATEVDGGFEFNGWHLYDEKYVRRPGKSIWWVADDTYVVALGPIHGYATVRTYRFSHWMPPYEGNILLLKREAAPDSEHAGPK